MKLSYDDKTKQEGDPLTCLIFTTELATAFSTGRNIENFFRQHLEHAVNSLLEHELTSFLDNKKWDPIGYDSGNSRNGGF